MFSKSQFFLLDVLSISEVANEEKQAFSGTTYVALLDFPVKTIRQIQRLTNSNLPVKAQQCSSLCDQDDAGNALCFVHYWSSRNSHLQLPKFLSKINTALATGRSSSGGWGCPSPRELLWRFFSHLLFTDPFCGVGLYPQIASGRWRGQRTKSKDVWSVRVFLKKIIKSYVQQHAIVYKKCLGLSVVPCFLFNIRKD